MAKSKLLKAPPKKKAVVRTSKLMDEKYTGGEPEWAGADKWSEEKIRGAWRHALYYYNYHYTAGELRKYVSQVGTSKYSWSKDDVRAFNECEDHRVGVTLGAICKMLMRGAPAIEGDTDCFIEKKFTELLEYGRPKYAEKKPTTNNVINIQDRMRDKLHDILGEIEGHFDDYRATGSMPDLVAWFREINMPQQFVNQIAGAYLPQMQEMEELAAVKKKKNRTDAEDQLVEGYKNLSKDEFKRITDFYAKLSAALDTYGAVKKAVRKARVKKPPSKEKLVKKVKYCIQHDELNLVSVNPVDILNATQLWVYNVKTRKLGRYVAASDAGVLGIKGSSIVGFDTKQSVAKTLRKPQDQLKQFSNSGKVALRTFLEDIKAVAVNLNGRLSADWILLKVQK